MRPKRIGISSGIRPSLDLLRSAIGSRRSSGAFQPPCWRDIREENRWRRFSAHALACVLCINCPFIRPVHISHEPMVAPASRESLKIPPSRHQIDPSIHINRAAHDVPRKRRCEIGAGSADIHNADSPGRRPASLSPRAIGRVCSAIRR